MTDTIDVLESLYRDCHSAEEQLAKAKESLLAAALSMAPEVRAKTPDALTLRSRLYWHTPYIPGELLAEIFGVKIQKLSGVILPKRIEVACSVCRVAIELVVKSRSTLPATGGHVCGGCGETERLAKEEAERKRKAWLESEECKARTLAILRSMPYADYLKTDHWHAVRAKAREAAGYRCQLCNGSQRLNVHHRTYERLGCELPDDLTVLCEACHESFHRTRSLTRTG